MTEAPTTSGPVQGQHRFRVADLTGCVRGGVVVVGPVVQHSGEVVEQHGRVVRRVVAGADVGRGHAVVHGVALPCVHRVGGLGDRQLGHGVELDAGAGRQVETDDAAHVGARTPSVVSSITPLGGGTALSGPGVVLVASTLFVARSVPLSWASASAFAVSLSHSSVRLAQ